mgnify:CR=1 FL=1
MITVVFELNTPSPLNEVAVTLPKTSTLNAPPEDDSYPVKAPSDAYILPYTTALCAVRSPCLLNEKLLVTPSAVVVLY